MALKLAGKNTLDEMCMATPAIYRSSLIVRTASRLYCIRKLPAALDSLAAMALGIVLDTTSMTAGSGCRSALENHIQ